MPFRHAWWRPHLKRLANRGRLTGAFFACEMAATVMTLPEFPDSLARCVSEFPRCHVLVLGDAILDEYILGECSRISPEAPVPILKVTASRHVPGGAANTAANIVALGGRATLIASIGRDDAGAALRRRATDAGIDVLAVDRRTATLRKTRVVGQNQQIVRLDYEDDAAPDEGADAEVLSLFDASLGACDIVVVSDYAKGLLSPALAQAILQRARRAGRRVIVDPRPQNRDCYAGCDYLTPNWKESRALLNLPDAEPTPDEAARVARSLASALETNVVLTLGARGIRFCNQAATEEFALRTTAREVFDVSGAGDTVAAAFALSLAAGADHATAVAIANRAAGVAVAKFGTATVTAEEILQQSDALRLVPRHALADLATTLRVKGKRLVVITGSFDILRSAHLRMLNEARQKGDVLIVGLSGDARERALAGFERPIVAERQRADMLLSLRVVDYVHIFDELDPSAFLMAITPDVHVSAFDDSAALTERAAAT